MPRDQKINNVGELVASLNYFVIGNRVCHLYGNELAAAPHRALRTFPYFIANNECKTNSSRLSTIKIKFSWDACNVSIIQFTSAVLCRFFMFRCLVLGKVCWGNHKKNTNEVLFFLGTEAKLHQLHHYRKFIYLF